MREWGLEKYVGEGGHRGTWDLGCWEDREGMRDLGRWGTWGMEGHEEQRGVGVTEGMEDMEGRGHRRNGGWGWGDRGDGVPRRTEKERGIWGCGRQREIVGHGAQSELEVPGGTGRTEGQGWGTWVPQVVGTCPCLSRWEAAWLLAPRGGKQLSMARPGSACRAEGPNGRRTREAQGGRAGSLEQLLV